MGRKHTWSESSHLIYMCMTMGVCAYAYMHLHVCIYVYVYVHEHICVHLYVHVRGYSCFMYGHSKEHLCVCINGSYGGAVPPSMTSGKSKTYRCWVVRAVRL